MQGYRLTDSLWTVFKMKWRTTFYICVVLAVFLCEGTSSSESSTSDREDVQTEKFTPTSEWQKVKKGQPLPAGLHYRMNINTGETEAKLLDPEDTSKSEHTKTDLVSLPQEEIQDNSQEQFYMSKEELKKVLAELTADGETGQHDHGGHENEQQLKKKFRSYEELKREFGSLNLTVKTDMEIINELVSKGKEQVLGNDDEVVITTMKDLEYLVHQIDNAREFIRLGGLTDIIIPALNSSSSKVRAESLWLVGSAAQSNPKVQIAALNAGIIQKLVKVAVLDSDVTVNARAIYALSCLTRQFPAAQGKLVDEGGLATLSNILDSERISDFKTKVRVVTLIHDLMLERSYVLKAIEESEHRDLSSESEAVKKIQQHRRGELKEKLRQYNAVNLEKRLVEDGWCRRLSEFLWKLHKSGTNSGRTQRRDDLGSVVSKDVPYRPEHDAIEKVVGALLVMNKICLEEFKSDLKLIEVLQEFLLWYQDLSLREEVLQKQSVLKCSDSEDCEENEDSKSVIDDGDFYYTSIAKSLEELLSDLKNTKFRVKNAKDEL